MTSNIENSAEYNYFRSSVPLRVILVDSSSFSPGWKVYDCGPKHIRSPLIFLPPVSGTADIFFQLMLNLSRKGYRTLSAEHPPYWNVQDWCEGFRKLLDHYEFEKVHLFGASLGGFLAQKFADTTFLRPRVVSLFLCNSFYDTSVFNYSDACSVFHFLPSVILKKMVTGGLLVENKDIDIQNSIEFMVRKLDSLQQSDLASRLTLNCQQNKVDVTRLQHIAITLMDVYDDYALSYHVQETLCELYPKAKRATLKSGGNFPYLSRTDDCTLHLQIHLRLFEDTPYSAKVTGEEVASCS
uniref:Maspardin n=1 Tax=Cacopsylla melanoneura TaxID=428564 RepID=A0A8D8LKI3_9HEMI